VYIAAIFVKCINGNCTTDNHFRNTPLMYAAKYSHVDVVRVLLVGGADVDRADDYQLTALHFAASFGYLDVCRLLLDGGAKVDPVDKWQETPLHWAARRGHLSVVKLLVDREADVGLKNDKNQTARDVARYAGKEDVAVCLVSVSHG
jgi:ankyrin repeat protein